VSFHDCRVLTAYYHGKLRMFLLEYEKYLLDPASAQPLMTFEQYVLSLAAPSNVDANVRFLAMLEPYLAAYVGMYVAIRTGNWPLRNACIERLAVLVFAYSRPKYMAIVAQAMVSKVMLPREVLAQFEQGEWTVSFNGRRGANVALDEALEMGANK